MTQFETVDDVKEQIKGETNFHDELLNEIADHGVQNILHWIDYTDDEVEEINELAKAKIRELEFAQ